MRVIYRIARLELSNLFYSPVAWFLLILFVFLIGMEFAGTLEGIARAQELGRRELMALSTRLFYSPMGGLWGQVAYWFYMLLPLLTMGLISQEFNRGSIKLLFSAPISGYHIVLGKYLGIMLYGLLLVAIQLIAVLVAGNLVESFEWSAVLTGLLGLYLLFGLYAAVGLFMSTLTNYPIVSAIGMLALLTFLNVVSGVWQEYAFMRDVTYWLSLNGRVNSFIKGLICSEDVLYFLIVTAMFLCFAILKLKLIRENRSFGGKAARYFGVLVVVMVLGYVTSRPAMKWYYDATSLKNNTLTPVSQDLVARLDGKLKITTYENIFSGIYNISTRGITKDIARYERYLRFKPDIKLDYVFYYQADTTTDYFKRRYAGKTLIEARNDVAKIQRTRLSKYLTPEEIARAEAAKGIDLNEEGHRFVALIERENGQRTFLRIFADAERVPGETEISAALKRLAMKLPRVGFLSDYGARSMVGAKNRDYTHMIAEKTNRTALLNQGFDVVDVSLKRGYGELDELDLLVVAEPMQPFTGEELEMLFRYVESGKNLLLAGKPRTHSYLKPLMDRLGLQFEPGVLVQKPHLEYPANLFFCKATGDARDISRLWGSLYRRTNAPHYAPSLVMLGASAIEQVADKGFRVIPLLVGRDSAAWSELETIDFVNDTARLNPARGERAGIKTTMVGLERERGGHQQRIMVLGDADCFSMGEVDSFRRGVNAINEDLVMAMFDWFSYGELPVNTSRPRPVDNKLNLGTDAAGTLKNVLQWVIPSLLLLCGIFVLIRRKGK